MGPKKSHAQSDITDEADGRQESSEVNFTSLRMSNYPLLERPQPVGLYNLGNTCFLNSALQCLSHVAPLTLFFLHDLHKIHIDPPMNSDNIYHYGKVTDAYLKFLQNMWSGENKRFSPDGIRNAIGDLASQFTTYQQQDAHEFLVFLLNTIHNELKSSTNTNRTIIAKLFFNTIQSTTTCTECEANPKITSNVTCFLPISLVQNKRSFEIHFIPCRGDKSICSIAVSSNGSVQNLIDNFAKEMVLRYHRLRVYRWNDVGKEYKMKILLREIPEDKLMILDDGFDYECVDYSYTSYGADSLTLYDCIRQFGTSDTIEKFWLCKEGCHGKHAVKLMKFNCLAPVLIIHLKRFADENGLMKKINTDVDFPTDGLDMSEFEKGTARRRSNAIYDLIAVSNHMGSVYGGHYTAYARQNADKPWFLFDDDRVTRLDDQNRVVSRNAYLLIYLQRE